MIPLVHVISLNFSMSSNNLKVFNRVFMFLKIKIDFYLEIMVNFCQIVYTYSIVQTKYMD